MDAYVRNLLVMLHNHGGAPVVGECDTAKVFDLDEALRLRSIDYAGNGAAGAFDGYKLTRKGSAALGIERTFVRRTELSLARFPWNQTEIQSGSRERPRSRSAGVPYAILRLLKASNSTSRLTRPALISRTTDRK